MTFCHIQPCGTVQYTDDEHGAQKFGCYPFYLLWKDRHTKESNSPTSNFQDRPTKTPLSYIQE